MSEENGNSGIVINGGTHTGNNYATGDSATQTSTVHASQPQDALREAIELVAQIRRSLAEEPDGDLRDEIDDALTDTTDALNAQPAPDESAWRARLTRTSRAAARLGRRATALAEPLGQLAAAVLVVAGAAGAAGQ
ncbi:hypothetical protein [Streptomyces canus]|uniref:hypothetical protein n=1 Tax=Streptomyces canus TaxID=58343 RepID=UPI000748FFD2|nr:hypothetical protein [Streptomyces canus]KUN14117.1 hypothetical protein AQI96_05815 [Streptomyces canus]